MWKSILLSLVMMVSLVGQPLPPAAITGLSNRYIWVVPNPAAFQSIELTKKIKAYDFYMADGEATEVKTTTKFLVLPMIPPLTRSEVDILLVKLEDGSLSFLVLPTFINPTKLMLTITDKDEADGFLISPSGGYRDSHRIYLADPKILISNYMSAGAERSRIKEAKQTPIDWKKITTPESILKAIKPMVKSDFESSESYWNRVESSKRVVQFMIPLKFKEDWYFNADKGILTYQMSQSVSKSTDRVLNSYIGQTRMGIKFRVTEVARESTTIHIPIGHSFSLPMTSDYALKHTGNLGLVITGKVYKEKDEVWLAPASLDDPRSLTTTRHSLNMNDIRVYLVNLKTKQVLEEVRE